MRFYLTPRRNVIKGVNVERHQRRNNIFVVSQFWSLASGTKELLSRSRRIYCVPSRAISSRGSFRSASRMGRRTKYGSGTRIHLRNPYPTPYPREGIVTVLGHFSCSLFWGITPRDRDPCQRAVHVPWKMVGAHWTREERGDHITLRCRDRNISVRTLRSTQIDRIKQSDTTSEGDVNWQRQKS